MLQSFLRVLATGLALVTGAALAGDTGPWTFSSHTSGQPQFCAADSGTKAKGISLVSQGSRAWTLHFHSSTWSVPNSPGALRLMDENGLFVPVTGAYGADHNLNMNADLWTMQRLLKPFFTARSRTLSVVGANGKTWGSFNVEGLEVAFSVVRACSAALR